MIDIAQLRRHLQYDPNTGHILRNGQRAGTLNASGYRHVGLAGRYYLEHRVAWALTHGIWPKYPIDHVNGVRDDNRLSNLRMVTPSGNSLNRQRANSNNQAKLLGVSPSLGKWKARICKNGKYVHLGTFATPEEAHAAYLTAKKELS